MLPGAAVLADILRPGMVRRSSGPPGQHSDEPLDLEEDEPYITHYIPPEARRAELASLHHKAPASTSNEATREGGPNGEAEQAKAEVLKAWQRLKECQAARVKVQEQIRAADKKRHEDEQTGERLRLEIEADLELHERERLAAKAALTLLAEEARAEEAKLAKQEQRRRKQAQKRTKEKARRTPEGKTEPVAAVLHRDSAHGQAGSEPGADGASRAQAPQRLESPHAAPEEAAVKTIHENSHGAPGHSSAIPARSQDEAQCTPAPDLLQAEVTGGLNMSTQQELAEGLQRLQDHPAFASQTASVPSDQASSVQADLQPSGHPAHSSSHVQVPPASEQSAGGSKAQLGHQVTADATRSGVLPASHSGSASALAEHLDSIRLVDDATAERMPSSGDRLHQGGLETAADSKVSMSPQRFQPRSRMHAQADCSKVCPSFPKVPPFWSTTGTP